MAKKSRLINNNHAGVLKDFVHSSQEFASCPIQLTEFVVKFFIFKAVYDRGTLFEAGTEFSCDKSSSLWSKD